MAVLGTFLGIIVALALIVSTTLDTTTEGVLHQMISQIMRFSK